MTELAVKFLTGAIKTFPVPLYTFTSPSPETAEPIRLFVDFSTVKLRSFDQAIAKLPSILKTSFCNSISTNSSLGTGDSKATNPLPKRLKLNRRHSGYIGGLKETSARVMMANKPEQAMMIAVKGMLPHNSLGRKMLKKLRVYAGNEHENMAQKPEMWNF